MKRTLFVLVALIVMSLAIAKPTYPHPYSEALTVMDCMYPASYAFNLGSAASAYSAPGISSIYTQLSASRSLLINVYGSNGDWANYGVEYLHFLSLVNQLQQLYLQYGMLYGPGVNTLMSNYYGYQSTLMSCLNQGPD